VIAVIQPFVPNYRRPLFDAIDVELRQHGLRLEVWHDSPKGRVAARGNAASGNWSVPIKQHRLSLGRRNVTFRNVVKQARDVKAVVAGLASTNVETYALALDSRVRLMLWGHGRNFTASNNSLDMKIEQWLARRSTHVFTYTEEGKQHVVDQGLAPEKVTVVVNTTDTQTLRNELASATPELVAELRKAHDLGGARIALFIGAYDEPKQLPFLFDAMDRVAARHSDVVLVMAGAGPEEELVRSMAASRTYARVIGRLEAPQLAQISPAVELLVMPGRIGLVAVDALALGLPIATTRYPFHAPEAAYLRDGEDSLWTDFDVAAYADGVATLLSDEERLTALASAARAKGAEFSVESSARRFVTGILAGLDS
jgi:glycosyltransferase involved in cell wall biosynthesis